MSRTLPTVLLVLAAATPALAHPGGSNGYAVVTIEGDPYGTVSPSGRPRCRPRSARTSGGPGRGTPRAGIACSPSSATR